MFKFLLCKVICCILICFYNNYDFNKKLPTQQNNKKIIESLELEDVETKENINKQTNTQKIPTLFFNSLFLFFLLCMKKD